ncbi:hypothetical protein B0H16DRAFT_1509114 [Mycena metata]|uniref:Protein kinase domain-containing protein n=1 Tax=Mycena metata TaxID=1033252 RepID=A0AAD7JZF2_9AGAR|nr:hypothetical protein B0H16DRAFT_1509114 [Mycena metata]
MIEMFFYRVQNTLVNPPTSIARFSSAQLTPGLGLIDLKDEVTAQVRRDCTTVGVQSSFHLQVYDVSTLDVNIKESPPLPDFPSAMDWSELPATFRTGGFLTVVVVASMLQPPVQQPPVLVGFEGYAARSGYGQEAPSQLAQHPSRIQEEPAQRVLNDRPKPDLNIPPLSLLYRGFGGFIDMCTVPEHKFTDIVDEVKLTSAVREYALRSTDYYDDEEKRRYAILAPLNVIFHSTTTGLVLPDIVPSPNGPTRRASDGSSLTMLGSPDFVKKDKNSTHRNTSEAECEVTAYAVQLHKHALQGSVGAKRVYERYRVPTLLMLDQGASVQFIAFITLEDAPRVVSLTPTLGCRFDGADERSLDTLVDAFRAAIVLRRQIRSDVHAMLNASPPSPVIVDRTFPDVTSCAVWGGDPSKRLNFVLGWKWPTAPHSVPRLLFLARAGNHRVLVKFSMTYCPELHTFCYTLGHAPELLGFERLPGGWYVIVMEYLDRESGWGPLSSIMDTITRAAQERAYKEIAEVMKRFHEENWVHGDLRTTNILALHPDWHSDRPSYSTKLQIIDFDWGGQVGSARWPGFNLTDELRVRSSFTSADDLVIRKVDDDAVLKRTFHLKRQREEDEPGEGPTNKKSNLHRGCV